MFLPITLPKGVALTDIRRLKSHSAWYLRQAARYGPAFGVKRFAKAKHRRLKTICAITSVTARIGPVL